MTATTALSTPLSTVQGTSQGLVSGNSYLKRKSTYIFCFLPTSRDFSPRPLHKPKGKDLGENRNNEGRKLGRNGPVSNNGQSGQSALVKTPTTT